MNITKLMAVGLLLLAQTVAAQGFSNSSLSGCYVYSLSGNILGPDLDVDPATNQPIPNFQKLVLHGFAVVGRFCADGNGVTTEVSGTQNIAGLCVVPTVGTGTYNILEDGTGITTASTMIPAEASLPEGCALLAVKPGDTATFGFSFALEAEQECLKVIATRVATPAPVPVAAEGEACPQVTP